jgi:hypothetical protein
MCPVRYGGTVRNIFLSMYYWVLTAIGALAGNSVLLRPRTQAAVDRRSEGRDMAASDLAID